MSTRILCLFIALALMGGSGCSGGGSSDPANVSVAGVTLNKSSTSILVNGSEQLTASVVPDNATEKGVTWISAVPAIVDVDQNGVITPKTIGSVTITVTTVDGAKTAACVVTVTNKISYKLTGGSSFKELITPVIMDGSVFPTLPDDSVDASVPARFAMADTETTYQLWKEVYTWATDSARGSNVYTFAHAGQNGSDASGNGLNTSVSVQYPVTMVSWRDVMIWCNALTEYYNAVYGTARACVYCTDTIYGTPIRSVNTGTTITTTAGTEDNPCVNSAAKGFRLPSSNEYEFASRYIGLSAPSSTNVKIRNGVYYTSGESASGATDVWTNFAATGIVAIYNLATGTALVRTRNSNALGFYDLSGNVAEWCFDWYPGSSNSRVYRGGTWCDAVANVLRVGFASSSNPYNENYITGFRFMRTL
ncbi:MAG TPA: SUMF1/EgtB/PvdO family nonheme iron enzyme [Spirochaetota bacterium]